jgi:hypothetical protein
MSEAIELFSLLICERHDFDRVGGKASTTGSSNSLVPVDYRSIIPDEGERPGKLSTGALSDEIVGQGKV